MIFLPAFIAAVTAFMNTAFARDNGLTPDDAAPKSKGRRRSKKATA